MSKFRAYKTLVLTKIFHPSWGTEIRRLNCGYTCMIRPYPKIK